MQTTSLPSKKSKKHLIIIGGGASGFFCAINAAQLNSNLQITIIEKTKNLLTKVKVSGGGRCNVTNSCREIELLIKNYPRGNNFLKKSFHWFNTEDTINWFGKNNVLLKVEADGRMFPETNSSQTIIDCFLQQATKLNINIVLNTQVETIQKENNSFIINANNKFFEADYLCVAIGGFQKKEHYNLLENFQLSIEKPLPSLFTFNVYNSTIKSLMGVSVGNVGVKIRGTKFQQEGPLLITHWGFSGPAILKLSSYAAIELAEKQYNFFILINWVIDYSTEKLRTEIESCKAKFHRQKIYQKNVFSLPNRLWHFLLNLANIKEDDVWGQLTKKQFNNLINTLSNCEFEIRGKTTFKEEFVTCGGISLQEIDVNKMECKKVENLFFAGEVLNIDGITGGFNFQNAWTTGYIAAKAITEKSLDSITL